MKDPAHVNFVKHFDWKIMPPRQRVLAGFVLTAIMDGFRPGQEACLNNFLHQACLDILDNSGGEVRRELGSYFRSDLTSFFLFPFLVVLLLVDLISTVFISYFLLFCTCIIKVKNSDS